MRQASGDKLKLVIWSSDDFLHDIPNIMTKTFLHSYEVTLKRKMVIPILVNYTSTIPKTPLLW